MSREHMLPGGIANRGRVVRVGDTVRRPLRSWSPATHALLLHLEAVGFEGAPRFLGVDAQGREVLSYIPGQAVLTPFPAWALTDDALVSVAELLRDYHDAVSTFDPTPHTWPPSPPDAYLGDVVSHNDPNLDNIVFRDGRAVALIDFDLASPGSRTWDVACAARPGVRAVPAVRGQLWGRFRGPPRRRRGRAGQLRVVLRLDQEQRRERARGLRGVLEVGDERARGRGSAVARGPQIAASRCAGCLNTVAAVRPTGSS